ARRAGIMRVPRALPDALLLGQDGAPASLLHSLHSDGRFAVVNFMYTRCFSICLAMGTELQQLQAEIMRQGLNEAVHLLSISFDPADTPQQLARYAQSMRADASVWRFAMAPDAAQRNALLEAFGIVVVPAPMGQFEHNAAYHVVSPDGRLLRIVDLADVAAVLDYVSRGGP